MAMASTLNVHDPNAILTDIEMTGDQPVDTSRKRDDPYLIAFDEPFDPANPKDWPSVKKWTVTDVLSATGFNRIMVSTIMAPAISTIAVELNMNTAESMMALSIYLLATAFGPLFIGPLSEVYGRAPVLHASNVWFLIWNVVCGFAKTKGTLIAARLLAGFGASAVYALAGGVLGDVWRPEQRGKSLGIYLLIPLLGAAVGPIIGGFMAQRTTWRWMFWSTSAFQAVMVIASLMAFQETNPQIILRRQAEKKRSATRDQRYYTTSERTRNNTSATRYITHSLCQPFNFLAFHPIIQILSLLSAIEYGVLYIALATFSELWVEKYGQRVDISGLHYIAIAVGEISGALLGGRIMDRIFGRLKARSSSESKPEWHVPTMLPGALIAPAGLLIYGWAAQSHSHWLVVDIGMAIMTFGLQISGMPKQAYVIDSYPEHASSATAASQFLRSLTAFTFPLFAPVEVFWVTQCSLALGMCDLSYTKMLPHYGLDQTLSTST
ncbi:hypothetical protein Q7P37_006134 [Cladosporium fusiforme]